MNAVISYFLERSASIALLIIAIYFLCKTVIVFYKYHSEIQQTKEKVDNLPCETNKNVLNNVVGRLNNLERTTKSTNEIVTDMKATLTKISNWVMKKDTNMIDSFSQKQSPRTLNELGMKLFNDIGGNEFLKENKDSLFKFITESNPLAELDVEQAAYSAFLPLIPTPVFNKIKDFVYNSPSIEVADGKKREISLNDICFILSIPLRDMYLKEKGLTAKS
jgi:hypothetical protein